jgi:acyl-coenzyme A thioesterase PaaI-like protein
LIPSLLRNSELCFGCGPQNEAGLQLEFQMLPDGRLETRFRPRAIHGGWKGIFHGGLMATLLDEAMLAHLYLRNVHAATAALEVRFAEEVRLGDELVVHAWESSHRGRLHTMEATAQRDGKIVARAQAKCLIGRE